jgi:hypothetical protein
VLWLISQSRAMLEQFIPVARGIAPRKPSSTVPSGTPRLVGRLDDLFNAPVGNKPYERNSNIEYDRDPRLNKGQQNRRGVDRE